MDENAAQTLGLRYPLLHIAAIAAVTSSDFRRRLPVIAISLLLRSNRYCLPKEPLLGRVLVLQRISRLKQGKFYNAIALR